MAEQKPTGYFAKRQHMIYYVYVDMLVRGLASDARCLIDVGSHNTSYIERFDWIEKRCALDLRKPYSSSQVEGIKADFLTFEPSQPFDFATCFQVLEHVDDVQRFAAKLMDISKRVLISVPYMWPVNSHWDHKHDLIDLDTLIAWFGRSPDYHIIVQEPLNVGRKSRRIIAYYHEGEMPPLHQLRAKMVSV